MNSGRSNHEDQLGTKKAQDIFYQQDFKLYCTLFTWVTTASKTSPLKGLKTIACKKKCDPHIKVTAYLQGCLTKWCSVSRWNWRYLNPFIKLKLYSTILRILKWNELSNFSGPLNASPFTFWKLSVKANFVSWQINFSGPKHVCILPYSIVMWFKVT